MRSTSTLLFSTKSLSTIVHSVMKDIIFCLWMTVPHDSLQISGISILIFIPFILVIPLELQQNCQFRLGADVPKLG